MMATKTTLPSARQNGADAPDLSIVLVCWNNKKYLEPCLRSLFDAPMRSTFEVVVTDNGSTDGSREMLRDRFPQVQVICNADNVGLGRASNQGIQATKGRYVLLLNNDTLVNGASFDAMVEFMENTPRAAAVGGKLLNPDGTVQSCHNDFPSLAQEFLIATRLGDWTSPGYPANIKANRAMPVGWVCSACVMLRRDALVQVGLLDEDYFIYGDEVDLQYRLTKAGWQVYFLPHATTVHYGGRSMDRWPRRRMVYRGKILFFQKNYGRFQTLILRGVLALISIGKLLAWAPVMLHPRWRVRGQKEFASNVSVLRLCWKPA